MKKTIFTILIACIALLNACKHDQENYSRTGFDSEYGKTSDGLTIMAVGQNITTIFLKGNIYVEAGSVKVLLADPDSNNVYLETFNAPCDTIINTCFSSTPGCWKLKYESIEGNGKINLHISN